MNHTVIRSAFDKMKADFIDARMEKIYEDIYRQVSGVSSDILAARITSLESDKVIGFYLETEKEIRRVSKTAMSEVGLSNQDASLIWTKVRNQAKAPKMQLCNQSQYAVPQDRGGKAGEEYRKTARLESRERQPLLKTKGMWIMLAGAAVEVVGWLFVPSMKSWGAIVKGIGIVLMAGGAVALYEESKQKPRISLTIQAEESARKESQKQIYDICMKQSALNSKILRGWADQICDILIDVCEEKLKERE